MKEVKNLDISKEIEINELNKEAVKIYLESGTKEARENYQKKIREGKYLGYVYQDFKWWYDSFDNLLTNALLSSMGAFKVLIIDDLICDSSYYLDNLIKISSINNLGIKLLTIDLNNLNGKEDEQVSKYLKNNRVIIQIIGKEELNYVNLIGLEAYEKLKRTTIKIRDAEEYKAETGESLFKVRDNFNI